MIAHQYDQQSALIGAAIENAPDAFIVVDRDGNVLYVNNAFAKLAEKPRKELLVSKHKSLNIADDFNIRIGEIEEGKPFNETLYTEMLGASPKWVEVSANSFTVGGETEAYIACLRDVTKKKVVEEKLKGLIEKL